MAKEVIVLEVKTDTSQAGQSVGNFKKQLKDANNELQSMAAQFGLTSKEAQNAAQKVANLKDSIGDAKALAETFNPDKKFVALGGALQGVTAGFSAFSGAMGVLGADSKKTEELLLKVQSAMALQQGISGIMGAIDSFKMLGTAIKGPVVKAFTTLKGAIIGTGIGALVVGIGLLIANFEDVKKAVLNLVPGLAKVGEWIGKLIDGFTDFIGVTSDATREMDKLIAAADEGIKRNEKFMAEQGDQVDKYTQRKIEAKNRYYEEIKKDGANQVALANRVNRELQQIDKDRITDQENAAKKEVKIVEKKKFELEKVTGIRGKGGAVDSVAAAQAEQKRLEDEAKLKEEEDFQNSLLQIDNTGAAARQAAERERAAVELADAKILAQQKQQLAYDSINALGALSQALGQQTAAGKALSVASALISTYQGIAKGVAMGMPWGIPSIIAASATGFAAVKNILKTQIPGQSGSTTANTSFSPTTVAPIRPQVQTTTLDQNSINAVGNAANRAYVLESDVSGNQERVRRLNRAARIS